MFQVFPLVELGGSVHLERFWNGKSRQQDVFLEVEEVNPVNDHVRVVDRFGNITEQVFHLGLRLEIKLIVREFEAPVFNMRIVVHEILVSGCAFLFTRVNAQQDVVRIKIFAVGIVAVVRCNYRNIVFFRIFKQRIINRVLFFQVVAINPS